MQMKFDFRRSLIIEPRKSASVLFHTGDIGRNWLRVSLLVGFAATIL